MVPLARRTGAAVPAPPPAGPSPPPLTAAPRTNVASASAGYPHQPAAFGARASAPSQPISAAAKAG